MKTCGRFFIAFIVLLASTAFGAQAGSLRGTYTYDELAEIIEGKSEQEVIELLGTPTDRMCAQGSHDAGQCLPLPSTYWNYSMDRSYKRSFSIADRVPGDRSHRNTNLTFVFRNSKAVTGLNPATGAWDRFYGMEKLLKNKSPEIVTRFLGKPNQVTDSAQGSMWLYSLQSRDYSVIDKTPQSHLSVFFEYLTYLKCIDATINPKKPSKQCTSETSSIRAVSAILATGDMNKIEAEKARLRGEITRNSP